MTQPLIAKIEYNHNCICSDVPERYPDVSIKYLAEIGQKGRNISHLFNLRGDELANFIDALRGHPTTSAVEILRKIGDSAEVITITKEDASTAHALREAGCAFVSVPVYDAGIEEIKILAPSFEAFSQFLDSLKNSYNVKVASKHFLRDNEKIRPESLMESGFLEFVSAADLLTKRQAEALKLAARLNYYDMPRRTSLQDIADKMGISESAASELLRKAERKLLPVIARMLELQN